MPRVHDLMGQNFGRLTVVGRAENDRHGKTRWVCQCECGNVLVANGLNLLKGRTKSCGCLNKERAHGKVDTRLHRIWTCMKTRCSNPSHEAYYRYGGRGILVCDEWSNNFMSFYDWAMANGYADDLTLDRIDNDKGYYPDNCRWATNDEQNNNRRDNHLITYKGKTQTIKKWADELGINRVTLQARITRFHWDIERAMTTKDARERENRNVCDSLQVNCIECD